MTIYNMNSGDAYKGGVLYNGFAKHGIGSLEMTNKDSYYGGFSYDCFDGYGWYEWKDESKYIGYWNEGIIS
jgi:hypothetical protein